MLIKVDSSIFQCQDGKIELDGKQVGSYPSEATIMFQDGVLLADDKILYTLPKDHPIRGAISNATISYGASVYLGDSSSVATGLTVGKGATFINGPYHGNIKDLLGF